MEEKVTGNQLLSNFVPVVTTYAYDRRGKLTAEYEEEVLTKSHSYNMQNLLEKSVIRNIEADIHTVTYAYNYFGQRISKKSGIDEVRYLTDMTRDHYNFLAQSINWQTTPFTYDDNVVSFEREGTRNFYQLDELGRTMYLTGTDGAAYNPYAYDPFGNMLDLTTGKRRKAPENKQSKAYTREGNLIQPFAFTGYREDETDHYYAQARSYDPLSGRFTGEDRVRGLVLFPETQNHYVYCWNAPLGLVDLNGMFPSVLAGAIGGAIAGAVTYGVGAAISGEFSWSGLAGATAGGAATGALVGAGVTDPRILGAAYGATSAMVSGTIETAQDTYKAYKDGKSLGEVIQTAHDGMRNTQINTVVAGGAGFVMGGVFSKLGKTATVVAGAAMRGGGTLISELLDENEGVRWGRVVRNTVAGAAETYTAITTFGGLNAALKEGGSLGYMGRTALSSMKNSVAGDLATLRKGFFRNLARLLPAMGSAGPNGKKCTGENGSNPKNASGNSSNNSEEAGNKSDKKSKIPDWLLERWKAGNDFNKQNRPRYPYNEVEVKGENKNYVVDSYEPNSEIVSRKYTQLSEVSEATAKGYINELAHKYPSGAEITDSLFNPKVLRGTKMTGDLILEVPVQNEPIPEAVIDAANSKGITIRDVNGKVYN